MLRRISPPEQAKQIHRECDMNMQEGNVYMSALCSKLALCSILKAENDSAGSKVQPAPTTAKCVMR